MTKSIMVKTFAVMMVLLASVTQIACTASEQSIPTAVTVYKTSTCPCCDSWIKHMSEEGFQVTTEVRDNDMDRIKATNGVTDKLASCHTAKVGGYVIEGHVPASDVKRLLKEKPADVVGLTAPGMPMKSPGMQAEGLPPKGYDVIAFKKDGSTKVYTRY
ncbi:MAG TPA: DUF411 domain-containing protein [Mariprofundaceae bacterium]|nr:DUF411 domain-containing protein [Mariprofundaceae bacterium]